VSLGGTHHQRSLTIAFPPSGMGQPGKQATEAETNQKQVEHRKRLLEVCGAVLRRPSVKGPSVFMGRAVKRE
jgi:hypothetical protein